MESLAVKSLITLVKGKTLSQVVKLCDGNSSIGSVCYASKESIMLILTTCEGIHANELVVEADGSRRKQKRKFFSPS